MKVLCSELGVHREIWLPMNIRQMVSGFTLAIEKYNCELALSAHQQVYARVLVKEIQPQSSWNALTTQQTNPWVNYTGNTVEMAQHWVLVSDLLICNITADEIQTIQDGNWTRGFPRNQTALIKCILPARDIIPL